MQNKTYGQGSDPCHGPERTRRMKHKNELLGLTGGLGNLNGGVTSWYKGSQGVNMVGAHLLDPVMTYGNETATVLTCVGSRPQ